MPIADIARLYGVVYHTIVVSTRGRVKRRQPKAINERERQYPYIIAEMRADGATWQTVAETLGIHKRQAQRYMSDVTGSPQSCFDIEAREYCYPSEQCPVSECRARALPVTAAR